MAFALLRPNADRGVCRRRRRGRVFRYGVVRSGVALQRPRRAARGDETVRPALFAAAPAAGRFDRRSHGVLMACLSERRPRLSMWRGGGGGRSKARIRDAALLREARGAGATRRANGRGAPGGPGAGAQRDRRLSAADIDRAERARNAAPRSASDRNVARGTHAPRPAQQPSRGAAPSTKRPAPRPASSRRAGLPTASTPGAATMPLKDDGPDGKTSTWRRRWASA